jgi:hypothetical protein
MKEDGAQRGFERFTEVLHNSLLEMRTDMQTLRADLLKDQRGQMLRFAALVALVTGLIGAVLKFL